MIQRSRHAVLSNHGNPIVTTYRAAINKDNVMELVEAGKFNLYEDIQSHKDSVDINAIIERAAAGDMSVLQRRQPLYFDATEFPSTYAEMYQKIIDATEYFERLPLETREKFGHSPETFFASIGTDLWNDAMKDFIEPNKDSVVEKPSVDVVPVAKEGDVVE
mgnify:FL=1